MKRLILGLAAFSFLSFVGLQTIHRHEKITQESCEICLLGGQAVWHAPAAAPAAAAAATWETISREKNLRLNFSYRGGTSARAPPRA